MPRIVIAAPGSGHGKTTVATGLMAALRAEGLAVAGFKVGPDYIDPGYHALATGRPGRNLDPHLCSPELMAPLLLHGFATPEPADVAVIEGVMGLFDGQLGGDGFASTAHVAGLVGAPVILVLDISHMSRTAAAIVHGLTTFDPGVRLSGVILNKAGSPRHAAEIVPRHGGDRARGARGAAPRRRDRGPLAAPRAGPGRGAGQRRGQPGPAGRRRCASTCDLTKVLAIAHAAPRADGRRLGPRPAWSTPPGPARPRVAIAAGRAFTFRYAETEELLRAAGCEPVTFDPLTDRPLPEGTAGLYLGGGFPEVHADRAQRQRRRSGRSWGGRSPPGCRRSPNAPGCSTSAAAVDGAPMVGAIDAEAAMTRRLTLRYRTPDRRGRPAAGAGRDPGHRARVPPDDGRAGQRRRLRPGWSTGEPVGFSARPGRRRARRPCTPATSTCTGPGTPGWRSGSPTPCTRTRPPGFRPWLERA